MQFDTPTPHSKSNGLRKRKQHSSSNRLTPLHGRKKNSTLKTFCVRILKRRAQTVIVLVHISSSIYWHIRVITFIPHFCVTLHSQSMFIELEEKWFTRYALYSTKCIQLEYLSKFDQLSISTQNVLKSIFVVICLSFIFILSVRSAFFSPSIFSPISLTTHSPPSIAQHSVAWNNVA